MLGVCPSFFCSFACFAQEGAGAETWGFGVASVGCTLAFGFVRPSMAGCWVAGEWVYIFSMLLGVVSVLFAALF